MLVEKPIQCHLCTAIQEYNPYTVSTRGLPFPHFLVVLICNFLRLFSIEGFEVMNGTSGGG